uniref:Ig-like domain-containing protein n=1 Tax=Cyprinus carpio TaxID=7962 RepID=A0A8C2EVQ5_CYPCA
MQFIRCQLFCCSDVDVVQEDNVKIVRAGEDVNFTCTFSNVLQATKAWIKQTAYGKSLQIVSSYLNQPTSWNEDFEKTNRFYVIKGDDHFNLTILKVKPSDTATYFCVVSSYHMIGMGAGSRLFVGDAAIGDSVSLQCSLFTESCAGEHSVYWFRQSSGESQGVLYTKGERNGQCENSTESQTQSCVYSLFNSNVSHSDAGIYYCAVAACGEILFGKGTELNFRGKVFGKVLHVFTQENIFIQILGEIIQLNCSTISFLNYNRNPTTDVCSVYLLYSILGFFDT